MARRPRCELRLVTSQSGPRSAFAGRLISWLGSPRRTPSNDTMVMSSVRNRHRRKRVTFCRQKEWSQPCQKGSGTSSYALHRTSTSSASGVRERIRDDLRRCREQRFRENVASCIVDFPALLDVYIMRLGESNCLSIPLFETISPFISRLHRRTSLTLAHE
jgi:hypothetical protein